MTFGKYTYGIENLNIETWNSADGKLIIGCFCSIAKNVLVQLGGNHRMDWGSTYPFPAFSNKWKGVDPTLKYAWSKGDVIIGNDVWIGRNVTILSGVKIGDGAVIGCGCIVSKDIPPYAIVVGNPCEIKKYRFTPEQIEKLLKIKWWEWSDEKIDDNLNLICSHNIDEFINKHSVN